MRPLCWLGAAAVLLVAASGQVRADFMVSHTWANGDPVEPQRLFRDAIPSVFTSMKSFPGTINEADFYQTYDLFNPNNSPTPVFITVTSDFQSFGSIYLDSFNPNNLAMNYLGDAGVSGNSTFSITAPADAHLVLGVNSIDGTGSASLGHSYTVSVTGADPVPEPSTLTLLGIGTLGLAAYGWRRRRAAA